MPSDCVSSFENNTIGTQSLLDECLQMHADFNHTMSYATAKAYVQCVCHCKGNVSRVRLADCNASHVTATSHSTMCNTNKALEVVLGTTRCISNVNNISNNPAS